MCNLANDENMNEPNAVNASLPRLRVLKNGLYVVTVWLAAAFIVLTIHCKSYYIELLLIGCILTAAVLIVFKKSLRQNRLLQWLCIPLGIAGATCILTISIWAEMNACDMPENSCRNPGFQGKVLVLTPHQDDELNLMGGALETITPGSEVHFLYYTNGGETRAKESARALGRFGIGEDCISSLGYGAGGWDAAHAQMYDAPKDQMVERSGTNRTYGLPHAKCFRENRSFTQAHFEEDLHDFIKEMQPDIIVSVDFDLHGDHRELSLTAERVLGNIMKENGTYRPTVLKAFAYSTSWFQPPDFYGENLKSTRYMGSDGSMEEVNCYQWDDRLRIPVGKSSITRTLVGNKTAQAFNEHASQQLANTRTNERICNGDKVFWWRPTSNLMWKANVSASSGDASQIHDFLLFDTNNVSDFSHRPYEHGWCPSDGVGELEVNWDTPTVVREIHLFDQNNPANQIKHLTIRLSNGKELSVGPLPAKGTRVAVSTECSEPIMGFTIHIDASTGWGSGLAEVEAYAESPVPPFQVAKLQDANGDFMYDYTTMPEGELPFSLYTWGCNAGDMKVALRSQTTDGILLEHKNGTYKLNIPKGESCILTVFGPDGNIMDEAKVANPGSMVRATRLLQRQMEPLIMELSWESQNRYFSALLAWLVSFIR